MADAKKAPTSTWALVRRLIGLSFPAADLAAAKLMLRRFESFGN